MYTEEQTHKEILGMLAHPTYKSIINQTSLVDRKFN